MCVSARTCLILSVFVYAAVIGLAQTVISELLDAHGKSFFVPFLHVQADLFLEIVPSFPGLENISVHVTDSANLNSFNRTMSRSSVLKLEFSEIFTNVNCSGVRLTSSDDVCVYIKQLLGDTTALNPLDTMDSQYLLPGISSARTYSVYVYSGLQQTIISVCGNCTVHLPDRTPQLCSNENFYTLDVFQTLTLDNYNDVMYIKGDKPFGVILVASGLFYDAVNTSVNKTDEIVLECVPPLTSLGKLFYFWVHQEITLFTLSVTALQTTNITIHRDNYKVQIQIEANVTKTFNIQHVSDVAVTSQHRLIVFVVIDVNSWQAGFFLPPLEQYTVCQRTDSCVEVCPLVPLREFENEAFQSQTTFSFSDFSDARYLHIVVDTDTDFENSTIAKMQLNHSHLFFFYDGASGSVYHVGSMVRKLGSVCIPSSSLSRPGDAVDNDCDGMIDEEIVDGVDNDGDSLVDEDVTCSTDVSTNKSLSAIDRWLNGDYYDDDTVTQRPLIAVIVSLCVAIFAVFALISLYMLFELIARRRQIRNTKIRPFVS